MLLDEYKRSLKLPEAEEILDLGIFRPSAFVLVKALCRLPVTPNGVTLASLVCGLLAAWNFATGRTGAFLAGAVWYAAANILDCADGQLARLQGSGTSFGRVIDGAADYISSIALFLGIGAGLAARDSPHWWLVAAAALSSGVHAFFFDHYQNEYISAVRTGTRLLGREIGQFEDEIRTLRARGRAWLKVFVLSLYVFYLRLQERVGTPPSASAGDPQSFRSAYRRSIRLWSFLGPTTNRTLLMACALADRVDWYLLAVVSAGNAWLAVASLAQRRSGKGASA